MDAFITCTSTFTPANIPKTSVKYLSSQYGDIISLHTVAHLLSYYPSNFFQPTENGGYLRRSQRRTASAARAARTWAPSGSDGARSPSPGGRYWSPETARPWRGGGDTVSMGSARAGRNGNYIRWPLLAKWRICSRTLSNRNTNIPSTKHIKKT